MITLSQIEAEIKIGIKAKDQVKTDTLRGLKLRIQNEQIAKGRPLTEDEILMLVKSETKRRKESAEAFIKGERKEMAEKELLEAGILEKYLPEQISESELITEIEKIIIEEKATSKDFGKIMGKLKAKFSSTADGAVLAKILKEKLK